MSMCKELEQQNCESVSMCQDTAIYACFAHEIYGDSSKNTIIKQECDEYMTNNKPFCDYKQASSLNISVIFKTRLGKSHTFNIDVNITIKKLKDKIGYNLHNLEAKKLIYAGKILHDKQTLKTIGMKEKDSMIAMFQNITNPSYASLSSATIIKFEKSNTLMTLSLTSSRLILLALCELYNVRIRIFEYDTNKKLFMSDCYGEHPKTHNLPLILLLKKRENVYDVLKGKKCAWKRPLKSAVDRPSTVSIRDINMRKYSPSNKRKLDGDNVVSELESGDPPLKRRKYNSLNEKYLSTMNELNSVKQKNQALNMKVGVLNEYKQKQESLSKKVPVESKTSGTENIYLMDLDELNELKATSQNKIKLIEEAETQLIDKTYKCVACMDRQKNISFMDGCNHIALCDKCEATLQSKCCPICQTPYTNIRIMNF